MGVDRFEEVVDGEWVGGDVVEVRVVVVVDGVDDKGEEDGGLGGELVEVDLVGVVGGVEVVGVMDEVGDVEVEKEGLGGVVEVKSIESGVVGD